MKKILVAVLALSMVFTGALTVFADSKSNMDPETFETRRMEQIDDALDQGAITFEQAELLRNHILKVLEDQSFGTGPSNGVKGDGNTTCVLGEDLNLSIFRSESAGQKTGNGNVIGIKDGLGNGAENVKRNNTQNQREGLGACE